MALKIKHGCSVSHDGLFLKGRLASLWTFILLSSCGPEAEITSGWHASLMAYTKGMYMQVGKGIVVDSVGHWVAFAQGQPCNCDVAWDSVTEQWWLIMLRGTNTLIPISRLKVTKVHGMARSPQWWMNNSKWKCSCLGLPVPEIQRINDSLWLTIFWWHLVVSMSAALHRIIISSLVS